MKPRARDLGIPFEGEPGPLNAITDVSGVEVGHATLISGDGPLRVGRGPVRTGVTAVLPRGRTSQDPVFAAVFALNANGEMTGSAWIEESGFLDGPVAITNTHSVGVVRDALIVWRLDRGQRPGTNREGEWHLPVVAETWDGWLNDINGFHVRPQHAFQALDRAARGPVAEGNVGGGTGMISYGWKGGIGTASRRLDATSEIYTLGALAQCNAGAPRDLRISGVPVGLEMLAPTPVGRVGRARTRHRSQAASSPGRSAPAESGTAEHLGSIIVLIATDAPLLPHQLRRVARRAALGYARTGSYSHHTSGDFVLAFSTANAGAADPARPPAIVMMPNDALDPVFRAAAEATEEAIVNAMIAAETMAGADGRVVEALPHDRLRDVLRRYGRLEDRPGRRVGSGPGQGRGGHRRPAKGEAVGRHPDEARAARRRPAEGQPHARGRKLDRAKGRNVGEDLP